MNRKQIALSTAALALSVGLAVAAAQPASTAAPAPRAGAHLGAAGRTFLDGGRRRTGIDPRRIAAYLQLSDDQRTQARAMLQQRRESMRPLHEQQRALHEQLETMLDDPQADAAALGKLVQQLHANRQSFATARKQTATQLETLLDPDQKTRFEQLQTVMEGMRRAGRGRAALGQ